MLALDRPASRDSAHARHSLVEDHELRRKPFHRLDGGFSRFSLAYQPEGRDRRDHVAHDAPEPRLVINYQHWDRAVPSPIIRCPAPRTRATHRWLLLWRLAPRPGPLLRSWKSVPQAGV